MLATRGRCLLLNLLALLSTKVQKKHIMRFCACSKRLVRRQGTRGRCLLLNLLALLLNLLALLALLRLLEAAVQNAGNARQVFTAQFARFT